MVKCVNIHVGLPVPLPLHVSQHLVAATEVTGLNPPLFRYTTYVFQASMWHDSAEDDSVINLLLE